MGGIMSSLRGSPAPSSPSHVNQYYTASHCATHTQDIHLTLTISTSVPPVETTKNPAHQAASSAQSEHQTQAQTQTGPERQEFQGQEMNNSASSGNENSHGVCDPLKEQVVVVVVVF